ETANNVEILSHKRVAVHVDSAVDVDGVRRCFTDQIPAPDVWIRKRIAGNTVLFQICNRIQRHTNLFLRGRRIDYRLQLDQTRNQRQEENDVEDDLPSTAGRRLRLAEDPRKPRRIEPVLRIVGQHWSSNEREDR